MKNIAFIVSVLLLSLPIMSNAIVLKNYTGSEYVISIGKQGDSSCTEGKDVQVAPLFLALNFYPGVIVLEAKETTTICLLIEAGLYNGIFGPYNISNDCMVKINDHSSIIVGSEC